jgi:MraZ protein
MDGCVAVYTRAAWESLVARRLGGLDPFSREARQMSRFLLAGAADSELDRQGRVVLPQPLVAYARLGREVVVAGVGDHLEIWDRATWKAHLEEVEKNAEHVAERLAGRE